MREMILSVVRHAATFGGGWLATHWALDGALVPSMAAFAVAAAGFAYSVVDKADRPTAEMWQGLVRHAATFGGGIAASLGYVSEAALPDLIAGAVTVGGFLWGPISKLNRG